jgi:large subunit ribosomal protein L13
MKTFTQKTADVQRQWHLIDVSGKVLGHAATEIAKKLIGKDKPTFTPHIDGGDYVVVLNASQIQISGNKAQDKIYYSYSGYPGGLSQRTFADLLEKNPERIIEKAVYNMLPKNKLRSGRMTRLKVFAGAEHTHQSQLKETTKEVK